MADLLTKFSQTHGASGYEDDVRSLFTRELKKLVDEIEMTPLGSVIGIKRAQTRRTARTQAPRVLVEAHMDEIGFIVTSVEDGLIRFDEIGMFDPRVLPAQSVLVHGRKALPGVIGARPPHVLTAEDRKKTLALSDLYIDVGLSAERLQELVSVGDFITLNQNVIPLRNNFFAGKAFDDRASLVVLLEMLRQLQNVKHTWDVYVVANVNEEDSSMYVGALTSTFKIQPQIAICLDVTHAQQAGLNEEQLPRLKEGPCIARGANIHPYVFEKLQQAATREQIPHQITVYGSNTGTNAWMMQVAGEGVPTGLVELPLRYMHTSVETVQLDDIARAAELVRVFIASLGHEDLVLQSDGFVWDKQTVSVRKPKAAKRAPARKAKRRTMQPRARRRVTPRRTLRRQAALRRSTRRIKSAAKRRY
ncbi:MAG TPA: M42 family peptidase [Anaerolineae bacterium]|nr:M42 family peptidase [Anaerolineae bacterium]